MSKTIFLAGAAGAIGRRLAPLLAVHGWQVVGTTRSPEKAAWLEASGVRPVLVDVFDPDALAKTVAEARPAAVIHQLTDLPPGLDPAKMQDAVARNARIREEGTRNLVAAAIAAGVRRLLAQSVAFAYAEGPTPHVESDPLAVTAPPPAGVSARGVAELERQVLEAPLEGLVLRYGRFYGPGTGFEQPHRPPAVHVDAAAQGTVLALHRGRVGIYNMAEEDGVVSSRKAIDELGWSASFRQ